MVKEKTNQNIIQVEGALRMQKTQKALRTFELSQIIPYNMVCLCYTVSVFPFSFPLMENEAV